MLHYRIPRLTLSSGAVLMAVGILACSTPVQAEPPMGADPTMAVERASAALSDVDRMIAAWPNRPKLGALQMVAKYGAPQEITTEKLTWHDQGPYKRITVTQSEDHHDFPKPHMDYMEHTVSYRVPADKAAALSAYDGSLTFDRTRGEMSARCDLEGHNILTLNLANDIVTGKKNAQQARRAFGEIVGEDMMGKKPAYVTALQFEPGNNTSFADKPVIPGSPMRLMGDAQVKSDAEVLGLIVAINENEIVAAMEAGQKKISPQVADYAKMLHEQHGMNLGETLMLGQKVNVTPMETAAVDKLRVKGAGELAALTRLDGAEFEGAFVEAMIKGHTEVLDMIDTSLLKRADNEKIKQHLTATRVRIARHLAEAQKIQTSSPGLKEIAPSAGTSAD